ncbi:protein kinase domain-containing protein [Pectobacterium polaris]|uniref:protein kinase domain-containing protein n=1 Tax=Pectobacterium polaris TaxID=2042057 RepID=UPI00158308F0|nr:protein kinase [Pectobacterium polaris]
MSKYFRIDPKWSLVEAFEEINKYYIPGSMNTGAARNVQIENWGILIGRTRALAEVQTAIDSFGSKNKLCKHIKMTPRYFNMLIDFFQELPNDKKPGKIYQGMTIAGYFLLRKIGGGGNAVVWEVRDNNRKTHAMKILKKPNNTSIKRFNDEISTLKKIESSSDSNILAINIIDSYIHADDDISPWYLMPKAIPLEDYLAKNAPPPLTILKGMLEVCITLENLHQLKISHRDIKPDNIVIYKNKWYLCDFGIATFPGKNKVTNEGERLGSLHFYAPEMLESAEQSSGESADIYSFAKTLWVLLSGNKFPIAGELRTDRTESLLSTYCKMENIHHLDITISECTRFNPSERPNMYNIRECIETVLPK